MLISFSSHMLLCWHDPLVHWFEWVFCCARGFTIVRDSLHTLKLLMKMYPFCSKCKWVHPSLRMDSLATMWLPVHTGFTSCVFYHSWGATLIVSVSTDSIWCLLATLFVDLRAESWGKTQQQDNDFSLFFWPYFIVWHLCSLRNYSSPLRESNFSIYNDSWRPVWKQHCLCFL